MATLKSGDFFGERSLLTSEPCAATITADSTVLAFFIEKERFEQMLGPLKGLMEREMRKREQAERASKWQLADFEFNGRLGEGSMSRVILATHSPTGRSFALKSLRKGRLIRYNQLKRVCAEKKVSARGAAVSPLPHAPSPPTYTPNPRTHDGCLRCSRCAITPSSCVWSPSSTRRGPS